MTSDNNNRKDQAARGPKSSESNKAATRRFTAIVKAVGRFINLFRVDPADHVANGILICADGIARKASVVLDEESSHVAVSVHLGKVPTMTPARVACLQRVQRQAAVARLDYDAEDGELILRGSCIIPRRSNPAGMLSLLIADLQRVLADDRLEGLLAA